MSTNKDETIEPLTNYESEIVPEIPAIFPEEEKFKLPLNIKTKEELYAALAESRKQCENGQVITLEEFKRFWENKIGKFDV